MCGITGFFQSQPSADALLTVGAMIGTLRHRGPDQEGTRVLAGGRVALGHSRLSIVDLTPTGAQPMSSHSGRFNIVFNGEIYNHRELRARLSQGGHAPVWRGSSDTEVLLACIDTWGLKATLEQSAGMFAIALWDDEARTLTLARDRFGEKPLYYWRCDGRLAFASEMSALTRHPDFPAAIDMQSVRQFLRMSYVPAPWSIYRDTFKLRPGTLVTLAERDLRGLGELDCQPYWSAVAAADAARSRRAGGPGVGEEAWLARFEAEFGRVIRDQMVADVPVGAFLSGGIDSSAVVAFMMEAASQPVRTYSIGFASEGYNEVNHARAVAQHLGTSHTEYMFSESDLLDILPRVHEIYDEPFADSSQLPTLLVSKIARQSVTVALSGDGGDEVFGGYNRYRYATILQRMVQSVPRLARVAVSGALRSVPTTVLDAVVPRALRLVGRGDPGGIVGERLHKFSTAILDDEPTAIYEDLVRRDGRLIGVETGDRPIADAARHQLSSRGRNFSDYMMLMDALTYLPDDILTKVDRAAMSVSLETRVPFLDHKLFELAWELPDSLRVHGAITKRILRLALAKRVPAALFARPKSGFGVPIDQWLRGPLKSFASEVLFDGGQIDTFLDKSIVRTAWQRHQSGSASLHHLLWNCIVLSNWLAAHSSRTVSGPAAARGGVAMTPGVHHAG